MRKGAIQINNYFAKLVIGREDLLPTPRSQKVFRTLASVKVGSIPTRGAVDELLAASQLGIVTAPRWDGETVVWAIDAQRLSDISGDGMPQAAEQLAAALAISLEGLEARSYLLEISGPEAAVQYIDVFSTTYNALLARDLGVPSSLLVREWPRLPTHASMDEAMRARVKEANELAESHGVRRMYKLQHEGAKMMKDKIAKPQQPQQAGDTNRMTVWRHAQSGKDYKFTWYVELTESGKPARVSCNVEYGTEAQRATVEMYASLATHQLKQQGAQAVVQLGMGVRSGYFEKSSPIEEFTTVFATAFLSLDEQAQIGFKDHALAGQTDLLQSIEAAMCERCGNTIQQFGSYGICIQCGDAQIVKN